MNVSPHRQGILSLSNYLKNFCTPQTSFTTDILNGYWMTALQYEHWFNKRAELAREIMLLFRELDSQQQSPLPLTSVESILVQQIVRVDKLSEFAMLVYHRIERDGRRIKVLEQDSKLLVFILHPDQTFEVRIYQPHILIRGGEVDLIPPLTRLSYDSKLVLRSGVRQLVSLENFNLANFHFVDGLCEGSILRGYTLNRYQDLNRIELNQVPALFYAIRALETYFIKPDSDPLYQELVTYLDRVASLLRAKHPQAIKASGLALRRGKLALEKIFPNDRFLHLLVTDIEFSLLKMTSSVKEPHLMDAEFVGNDLVEIS